jgi:hypothetical protein
MDESTDNPETPQAPPAPAVFCCNHPDQPASACCCYCKKPICLQCMEKFGFLCSSHCLREATMAGIKVPVYEGQLNLVRERQARKQKWWIATTLLGIGVLLALYIWYHGWLTKPSVVMAVPLDTPEAGGWSAGTCRFAGPNRVLLWTGHILRLYDTGRRKEIWKKDLKVYRKARKATDETMEPSEDAENPANAEDEEKENFHLDFGAPACQVVGNRIWVRLPGHLVGFDRESGNEQKVVTWSGFSRCSSLDEDTFLVATAKTDGTHTLTRVDLRSGEATTTEIPISPLRKEMLAWQAEELEAARAAAAASTSSLESGAAPDYKPPQFLSEFSSAGNNLAQVEVRLLEAKVVTQKTMKEVKTRRSDDPNASVAHTGELAEEIINDMQRNVTGGVHQVDESRYEVTLRRFPSTDIPEWTGEVDGLPQLFSFKTMDLLAAGQQLIALDKQNRKLWETKLAFSPTEERDCTPGVESGPNLYFYDRGVLTAFEARTGQARWRLPSVGISKIQLDGRGMLYVTTTAASHESIQYSEQFSLSEDRSTVILKVDPATGRILWKIPKVGDTFYLSGKYVYATHAQVSGLRAIGAILNGTGLSRGGGSIPVNFRIFRINPSNGKVIWEYYRKGQPLSLDFQGRTIAAVFQNEFQLLRYLTMW